jgi:hypothetical protein
MPSILSKKMLIHSFELVAVPSSAERWGALTLAAPANPPENPRANSIERKMLAGSIFRTSTDK